MQYNNITTYINEMRVIAECITHSRTHLFLRSINYLREAKSFIKKPLDLTLSTLFYFWYKNGYLLSTLTLTLPVFLNHNTFFTVQVHILFFCTMKSEACCIPSPYLHCSLSRLPILFIALEFKLAAYCCCVFSHWPCLNFGLSRGELQTERRHGLVRVSAWLDWCDLIDDVVSVQMLHPQLEFFMYDIHHCFICRPSDSIVSEDAGIQPRSVATTALTIRRSNHSAGSHPQTRLNLIHK